MESAQNIVNHSVEDFVEKDHCTNPHGIHGRAPRSVIIETIKTLGGDQDLGGDQVPRR